MGRIVSLPMRIDSDKSTKRQLPMAFPIAIESEEGRKYFGKTLSLRSDAVSDADSIGSESENSVRQESRIL